MAKPELKKQAIKLRKNGKSYSEILEDVPVAKSTLSRWLRDVGLSQSQEQRLTKKKKAAQRRGAEAVRQKRIEKTKRIKKNARDEIDDISERELWLIGTALYWAEGTKEKPYRTSVRVSFGNSEGEMIELFIKWLVDIVGVAKDEIDCGIYIHEEHKYRIEEVKKYWQEKTGLSQESFGYVYYKDHNPETNRKNTGEDYYGMLQVRVQKSTDLNRKITGWIEGVIENV
jgi:hypothetical protein